MSRGWHKFWKIVFSIVFVSIPSVLTYLGTSNNCLDNWKNEGFLGNNIVVSELKDLLLLISVTITALFGSTVLIYQTIKKEDILVQRDAALRLYHKSFINSLKKSIRNLPQPLNLRIFLPNYKIYFLKQVLSILTLKKYKPNLQIKIKNLIIFSDEGNTKGLHLNVKPNVQGVAGKCFYEKIPQIENNAQTNKHKYNLLLQQEYKTKLEKFIVCIPLFDNKKYDKIIAVVSLDSHQQGNIKDGSEEEETLFEEAIVYSNSLQTYIPDIFK